jgi:hypothetical protein
MAKSGKVWYAVWSCAKQRLIYHGTSESRCVSEMKPGCFHGSGESPEAAFDECMNRRRKFNDVMKIRTDRHEANSDGATR